MLIGFLTLALMMMTAYAFMREGLATAFAMLCNIFIAGLVAFNFWEPLADALDPMFSGTGMHGYEDFLCLGLLFSASLALLRTASNRVLATQVEFESKIQQVGALVMGLFTGYLLAGFLACVLQTLPWYENFMGFDPRMDRASSTHKIRRWLPPDRIWLGLMQKASAVALSQDGSLFDSEGTFEVRYARFRRYTDSREALTPSGEAEVGK